MFNEELMEAGAESMVKNGLPMGRVLTDSSEYANATVSSAEGWNPFWYGDIDAKNDFSKLQIVAKELKTDIVVKSNYMASFIMVRHNS